ncbi:uncharacterized protein SPPG_01453 [Spizellomyces punctatus DAOM BR117]|uniref:Afadin-and alpha-actinin-binding protein n=1 Tax=Spizellomyces punctatus (strain DAOM BR117) TaxID=645134 RepID=A0A0L0HSX4_SPIPD|nr:uncharacterized protein SPPG_01453 [Spizellomyces punctatus DAOM BR117]KND04005.1 hypothetical protein SPPG_01453 [Spizellomyces punctatus DAOM BR117]|eukprot:XP_016612044.1 hypothetical protein SPPG_01453 [Spizellomyces punctatus DAOM BR117]
MAEIQDLEGGNSSETRSLSNLQKSVDFVNHELAAAGFPVALDFAGFGGNVDDAATVLNCICTLLQQRQKDVAYREDLQHRLRRTAGDNDELAGTVARMKARLEQCDREIATLNNKLDAAQNSLKKEVEKHHAAKEELKTTKANLQYSKTQYNHDLRKREREHHRLKDRMQRIVTEKSAAQKVAIKLANPLPKPKTNAGGGGQSKKEDEMYNIVIKNYEDREKDLLIENQTLRNTLYALYSELKTQFKNQITHEEDGSNGIECGHEGPLEVSDPTEKAQFQLPYSLVCHSVEERVKEAIMKLHDEWARLSETIASQHQADELQQLYEKVEAIEKECDEYRRIIAEQNRLLELSLNEQDAKSNEGLSAHLETSLMDLQEQRDELEQKCQQLEEERGKFTEAAIKLGIERAALQREKMAFEEERRSLATQKLLKSLPDTPGWLKSRMIPTATSPLQNRAQRAFAGAKSPQPPVTPFHMSYSSVKPTRAEVHGEEVDSNEFIIESDTFAQTPRPHANMHASFKEVDVSPPTETPASRITTASSHSSIKSALKKQTSMSSLNRSVRITLQGEREARSYKPGEEDSKENLLPSDGDKKPTRFRKSFIATSTPIDTRGGTTAREERG